MVFFMNKKKKKKKSLGPTNSKGKKNQQTKTLFVFPENKENPSAETHIHKQKNRKEKKILKNHTRP